MSRLKGWRVAVLERHFRAGGFTHTFRRPGGWEWDVGLHYVGGMAPGSQMRKLFDFVAGAQVKWNAMPDDYDHFCYPGIEFAARKGAAQYQRDLEAMFPEERANIEQYFRDVRGAAWWAARSFVANALESDDLRYAPDDHQRVSRSTISRSEAARAGSFAVGRLWATS
jgi:all-trans-retinol 13,14-reductase